jgi:putative DNA primase/helicase
VAIQLAISVATGRPLFGKATRQGRVVLFSGEDGAALLRYRLKFICGAMGVDLAELEGKLFILDATEGDPTLFSEVAIAGQRMGRTTSVYSALREFCKQHEVGLVIIDNASDAFDASEIDRSRVRGFMRALARIARECDAGVLLLAHVDKATSRQERIGGESYSGSTAWHNSARSRIFMRREADGTLVLEQQKNNLGRLSDPIRLTWPENGVPTLAAPLEQGREDRALLRLIGECAAERPPVYVATALTSPNNAARVLSTEPGYPSWLKAAQVHSLLRNAERSGLIVREKYRSSDRKERERWALTDAGRTFADLDAAEF